MRFPRARIISFEPLWEPAAIYEAVFQNDSGARLIRAAVGRERGAAVMRVTKENDSSSLLDVGPSHRAVYGSSVTERREVPCGPLGDFLAAGDLGKFNLLKIDTQGFELEVLKGIDNLSLFSVIYCEVSFQPLYVGQALASEIIAHLFHSGFNLVGVFNLDSDPRYGPLQADMLFVRQS
jgi:FkbM family methyltransferase